MKTAHLLASLILFLLPHNVTSQDLVTTVYDVGAGLCTVTQTPSGHYLIYDAGTYNLNRGRECYKSLRQDVPAGSTIDLLVLSHPDADHIYAANQILKWYQVKKVMRTGLDRGSVIWGMTDRFIDILEDIFGLEDLNLREQVIAQGSDFSVDGVQIKFIAGFHQSPEEWGLTRSSGEFYNGGSIIIRVSYRGQSILFTGDAIGRDRDSPDPGQVTAIEKVAVDNAGSVPIASEVLLAPHHGANNGSSLPFIQAVDPEFVMFSAGTHHDHPTDAAARRYLSHGVARCKMFRTDFGDDEDHTEELAGQPGHEWDYGEIDENRDVLGDDDIQVRISSDSLVTVPYLSDNDHLTLCHED